MPARLPDATRAHPIAIDGTPYPGVAFLSEVIDHPRITAGAWSYAADFDPPPPGGWAARLAPYLQETSAERLRIGRFCQIAHGVRFVTASANHARHALSSFPFPVFEGATREGYRPDTRDTTIGHDVWLGHGAIVGPGARIGSGVIVGAGAVVRGRVPDYAVVAGNPARVMRLRFTEPEIATLLRLAWWDWPQPRIEAATDALMAGDVAALEAHAP